MRACAGEDLRTGTRWLARSSNQRTAFQTITPELRHPGRTSSLEALASRVQQEPHEEARP
jgi:hypothetical protein